MPSASGTLFSVIYNVFCQRYYANAVYTEHHNFNHLYLSMNNDISEIFSSCGKKRVIYNYRGVYVSYTLSIDLYTMSSCKNTVVCRKLYLFKDLPIF